MPDRTVPGRAMSRSSRAETSRAGAERSGAAKTKRKEIEIEMIFNLEFGFKAGKRREGERKKREESAVQKKRFKFSSSVSIRIIKNQ